MIKEKVVLGVGNRRIIVPAPTESDCNWEDFPIRTRLNQDLDYIDGQTALPGRHLTIFIPEQAHYFVIVNSAIRTEGNQIGRQWGFGQYRTNLDSQRRRTSFLHPGFSRRLRLHRCAIPEETDPRWSEWEGIVTGQGAQMFGQQFKELQKESLSRILSKPRSLTIVGLPTGFGKTRIPQSATKLIRSTSGGDQGPTLIISPLISLMDDQRREWNALFKGEMKFRFITAAETTDKRKIYNELLNDEIDVLCCSPDSIIRPRRGVQPHWIEAIQEMENPFSLLVVDEAHTIADWGASIRPEFQLLDTVKRLILRRIKTSGYY